MKNDLLVIKVLTNDEVDREPIRSPIGYDHLILADKSRDYAECIEVPWNVSIGLKRLKGQQIALERGYKYLTFIDPDDEVICEDYFRLFPRGKKLVTCNKMRSKWTDRRILSHSIKFIDYLSPMVCHGPMNIIDLDVCRDNNIYYRDTWVDDPDFFIRYMRHVSDFECSHTSMECYNHVPSESLSYSQRFIDSCRKLIKSYDKDTYDDKTFRLFKEWFLRKFTLD